MASLLDMMMQARRGAGRGGMLDAPSSGEMLRARAGGLLGPAPERQPPSLFNAGGPGPAAPAGPAGPQPPQAAGPQAAPQPAPTGARRREPLPGEKGQSFLSLLFTGEPVGPDSGDGARLLTTLSKRDRDHLLRRGLLTAGLMMLGGNHSGRSFGEVLARGIFAAQQDTAQTAGELLDIRNAQIRLARRAQVFADADLTEVEKWEELRRLSATTGDTEGVNAATDVLDQFRELEAGEAEARFQDIQTPNGTITALVRELPDGGVQLRNPITGEVLDERSAPPVDDKERLSRINTLADDARRELSPLVESHRLASSALGAPEQDPAAQQTLIMALNKLLDPGSVVRASEFERVAEMGGLSAQAQEYWNRLTKEGQLPPQVEDSIRREIERLHAATQQEIQSLQQHWTRRATDAGVDPRLVFRSVVSGSLGSGAGGNGNGGRSAPVLFPEDEEGGR